MGYPAACVVRRDGGGPLPLTDEVHVAPVVELAWAGYELAALVAD